MAATPLAADLAAAIAALPLSRRKVVAVAGAIVAAVDIGDTAGTCDNGGESACVSAT
jgi:hypothetical protein